MVIEELTLHNFRNYSDFYTRWDSRINFIEGGNGQGKTNLIESIYFLANLKSFRTREYDHLIQEDCSSSWLKAVFREDKSTLYAQIELNPHSKRVLLNNKNISLSSEYILNFPIVLFSPDALFFFKNSLPKRREFFDRILFFFILFIWIG